MVEEVERGRGKRVVEKCGDGGGEGGGTLRIHKNNKAFLIDLNLEPLTSALGLDMTDQAMLTPAPISRYSRRLLSELQCRVK